MSVLDELRHDSGEHSELVHLVLGLIAAGEKLDARIAAEGFGDPAADADDPLLLAALGLVSLRQTAERWLRESVADAIDAPAPDSHGPRPRGLLR